MPWSPDTYNQFKSERFAPFEDLLSLVLRKEDLEVVDLGCGTGELTSRLASYLPSATIIGIDSSKEMLAKSAAFENDRLSFEHQTIESFIATGKKWDLVISNAAIQWVDDHEQLVPALLSTLKPGGQLVVQLPAQHQNLTNIMLDELADRPPYADALLNWKRTVSVLKVEKYAGLLFESGGTNIIALEKIYPLVLQDTDALFSWVSGTALIPYLERLPAALRESFTIDYKKSLEQHFPARPLFYPFKRILFSATV